MKYAVVQTRERRVTVVDVPSADDAKILAGLKPRETDEGTLYPGLAYICDEYAMFTHPQFYCAIGRTLIAGNIVLYAYSVANGMTLDYDLPAHRWGGIFLGDEAAAEAAIKAGKIDRPRMAMGGEVFWQWPAPKPDMEAWAQKMKDEMTKGRDVQIDDITIIQLDKGD